MKAIHQSSLGMAFRCGEQFRRRYLEKEIIPPGIAAGRGTGVHAASKVNLLQKLKSQKDMPLSDIQDATRDGYVKAFKNGVYLAKEDQPAKDKLLNEGLEDALRCSKVYLEAVAPQINPIAIEEPFHIEVPGIELPLEGTMDYQEKPKVGDLKTTSMKWPEGRINGEIQPVFYCFSHESTTNIRPEFIYHILIARRGKDGPTSEELQEQKLTPTDAHYHALFAKIRMFETMLNKGVFPPANPTAWWCDPKWCGYFYTCPYVGNNLPKQWI